MALQFDVGDAEGLSSPVLYVLLAFLHAHIELRPVTEIFCESSAGPVKPSQLALMPSWGSCTASGMTIKYSAALPFELCQSSSSMRTYLW